MGLGARVLVVAVAVVLVTVVFDWWAVPLVGAAWGLLAAPKTRPAIAAGLGGALGWLLLLAWTALHGPVPTLARRAGGVLEIGAWGLVGITVAYPLLLAAAGAVLAGAIRAKLLPGRSP